MRAGIAGEAGTSPHYRARPWDRLRATVSSCPQSMVRGSSFRPHSRGRCRPEDCLEPVLHRQREWIRPASLALPGSAGPWRSSLLLQVEAGWEHGPGLALRRAAQFHRHDQWTGMRQDERVWLACWAGPTSHSIHESPASGQHRLVGTWSVSARMWARLTLYSQTFPRLSVGHKTVPGSGLLKQV